MEGVNLQKKLSCTPKLCSLSRKRKNQEAGNTLFSLTDNIQVLLLGGDEKQAQPIHQNPAMTASTYVKPKVVFSWGGNKEKRE